MAVTFNRVDVVELLCWISVDTSDCWFGFLKLFIRLQAKDQKKEMYLKATPDQDVKHTRNDMEYKISHNKMYKLYKIHFVINEMSTHAS